MAINPVILDMVLKVAANVPAPRRMLCLGYPDMLVTEEQLAALCGAEAMAKVEFREDSEEIVRWHRLHGRMQRVAETRGLLAAVGIEAEFVDLVASRGFEMVVDLNREAPAELHGRYDIVYDGGTMEHCFNVGQVMRNIHAFAKVGGFIVHANPLNYYNHGFYNFSPTFYHDWYTQSGNAIVTPYFLVHGPVLDARIATVDATQSFAEAPERSVLLVVAMKRSAAPPDWPTQTKYLRNSELRS